MRRVMILLLCAITAPALAHGSDVREALLDSLPRRVPTQAEVGGAAQRQVRAEHEYELFRWMSVLRGVGQAVITDANDQIGALLEAQQRLGWQREMGQRELPAGYGTQQWSMEEYDARLAETVDQAFAAVEALRAMLPWAEVTCDAEGLKLNEITGTGTALVGRQEFAVVETINLTPGPLTVRAAGTIDRGEVLPQEVAHPARGTSLAVVPYRVEAAGDHQLTLQIAAAGSEAEAAFAISAATGYRVTVRVTDSTTHELTACKLYVRGADGRCAIPDGRPVVFAGKTARTFAYVDGTAEAVVPSGPILVRAEKGFEYEPASWEGEVEGETRAELSLDRWIDMPALGWYAGDTHVHWVKDNWYENGDPEWLDIHSRAEDLWVNNNLILKHWWKYVVTDEFPGGLVALRPDWAPVGPVEPLCTGGRIVWTGEEYRNDEVFGHMCFLGIDHLIEPVSTGFMGGPEGVHWPPNSYTYAEVHQAGGTVIAAHDVSMEVPIQVIQGRLDSLDAYGTRLYYDLLDCGFRLPLSVGSDYPANPMGFARVYVYCEDGLDYRGWLRALVAGRTFVSSGAMVVLDVDGEMPGGTVELEPGEARDVRVRGFAQCRRPLERVEIIHNGSVVRALTPPATPGRFELDEAIHVDGPGWIAARAFPAGGVTWWGQPDAGHTGPVYITRGDERLVMPDAVDRLIAVLQDGRARAEHSDLHESEERKQAVLAYYDQGIALYQALRDGRDPAPLTTRPRQ